MPSPFFFAGGRIFATLRRHTRVADTPGFDRGAGARQCGRSVCRHGNRSRIDFNRVHSAPIYSLGPGTHTIQLAGRHDGFSIDLIHIWIAACVDPGRLEDATLEPIPISGETCGPITSSPTPAPTALPSPSPAASLTAQPTAEPAASPTARPSADPTRQSTVNHGSPPTTPMPTTSLTQRCRRPRRRLHPAR